MSKPPAFPIFIDAYELDTDHLTLEEHGAYLRLLMFMWKGGGAIPDDDRDNARKLKVSAQKWLALKRRLMPFLEVYGPEVAQVLTQKRLQQEWSNSSAFRAIQRAKSARGGDATRKHYQELREISGLAPGTAPGTARDIARITAHGPSSGPARGTAPGTAALRKKEEEDNTSSTSETESSAREPAADAAAPLTGASSARSVNGPDLGPRNVPDMQPAEIPARLLTPLLQNTVNRSRK